MSILKCCSVVIIIVSTLVSAQPIQDSTTAIIKGESISPPELPGSTADTVSEKALPVKHPDQKIDHTPLLPEETSAAPLKKAETVVEEIEEELILDGNEESLLPSTAEKKLPSSVATIDSSIDSTASSASIKSDTLTDTPKAVKDSAKSVNDIEVNQYSVPSPVIPTYVEEKPPVKIETVQSINFAKNFKEYRSPKVAILMSLIIPGSGQAYTRNYIKTGIFGAVEATLIAVGAVFAYQGIKKHDDAESFADEHYKLDQFESYYSNLSGFFPDTTVKEIFTPDSNANVFLANAHKKNEEFYNDIGYELTPYIHGWDDVEPHFNSSFVINDPVTENGYYVQDDDSAYLVYFVNNDGDTIGFSDYGFSKNRKTYKDILAESSDKFRRSKTFFTMLLINHIVSAIDAGITAKAHNDRLLGKTSVWQKFNLRESVVNTPLGVANGLALEVRF